LHQTQQSWWKVLVGTPSLLQRRYGVSICTFVSSIASVFVLFYLL
jgi:hypothetical protein